MSKKQIGKLRAGQREERAGQWEERRQMRLSGWDAPVRREFAGCSHDERDGGSRLVGRLGPCAGRMVGGAPHPKSLDKQQR
jgi:hypothetical protein